MNYNYFIPPTKPTPMGFTDNTLPRVNHLIEQLNNAIEGYRNALEHTGDPELRAFFERMHSQHQNIASKLADAMVGYGAEPDETGTTAGAIHRSWMDLKAAVADHNGAAMLEACAFGEAQLDKEFEDALSSRDLSDELQDLVARQHETIHETTAYIRDFQKRYTEAV